MVFDGFSRKAFTFYRDLEESNTKEFWHANKSTWKEYVHQPMEELAAELASEFGEPKLWRPQRDVRFSRDKSPYKTQQGLTFGGASSVGYYLQLGADGVHLGAGFHGLSREQIARYRDAVDSGRSGESLRRLVDDLAGSGWQIVGDRLKSRPRGTPADHPRLELLRFTSLGAERLESPTAAASEDFSAKITSYFRELKPLVEWLHQHLSEEG